MKQSTANDPSFNERRSEAIRNLLVNTAQKGTAENRHYKATRRTWILVPSAALALALTGGTVALMQAQVSDKNQVHCFARAERNGSSFPGTTMTVLQGTTDQTSEAPPAVPIEDALALCSDMWKQHALDASVPNGAPAMQIDPKFSHPVPSPLTVCVWDGRAAVIPGGANVCAKLGLAEMASGTSP